MFTLLYPFLYSKTAVCKGIPIFLIIDLKHRLWVLVRTARQGDSNVCPQCFERKYKINVLSNEISYFTAEKKNHCILHGQVFVMIVL